MKKVLFLSYYFPPCGGSAVQRVLKFVKYLPENGWSPVVLTARPEDYVLRDESLLSEIPEGVTILRTKAPDVYRWTGRAGKGGNSADLAALAAGGRHGKGFFHRIVLFLRSLLFIPDARILWLPYALFHGLRAIRRERPTVILTSSPPFTTALVGGLLSKATGLPWVSDYRDPWTQAYFYFPRPRPARRIEEALERRLLNRARRVISINDRILEGLRRKYGMDEDERWEILPNGFDPADFQDVEPAREDGFTITYTGTLHARMHPGPFLEAVGRLMEEDAEFRENIRLRFIGRIADDIIPMLEDTALRGRVLRMGHLPHGECLRYTLGAGLLLLLIPPSEGNALIVTGKLFEYLRSGNPVLCLSEAGEAAEIVRDTGAGYTVAFEDVGGIQAAVRDAFARRRERRARPVDSRFLDKIRKFDRRENTRKLAGILDRVAGA